MTDPANKTEIVRRALREAAEADRPCPSNWALAELIGAAHPSQPSAIISRLEAQDEFRIMREHWGRRIVYADGAMTAPADYAPAVAKARASAAAAPLPTAPRRGARGAPCGSCGCRADACSCRKFIDRPMPSAATGSIVRAANYAAAAQPTHGTNG